MNDIKRKQQKTLLSEFLGEFVTDKHLRREASLLKISWLLWSLESGFTLLSLWNTDPDQNQNEGHLGNWRGLFHITIVPWGQCMFHIKIFNRKKNNLSTWKFLIAKKRSSSLCWICKKKSNTFYSHLLKLHFFKEKKTIREYFC